MKTEVFVVVVVYFFLLSSFSSSSFFFFTDVYIIWGIHIPIIQITPLTGYRD